MSGHGVAGLVLAAGAGTRFGRPKPLVSVGGRSVLERAVGVLVAGGCRRPICVVLGTVFHETLPMVADMLVTRSQPGIQAMAVERVIAAHEDGAVVAAATYDRRRGHPVLLDRTTWPEVRTLAIGDVGARAFTAAHPEIVTEVVCDDAGTTDDIDTKADLARFERDLQNGDSCT